jgi:ribosome-dependent ATPase
MFAYARREALELRRDPIRATLAMLGSVILMFVLGYGINMDVERLTFAVIDRDDTTVSRDYVDQIRGSRYFVEKAPITDYADLDRRMRQGDIGVAIETRRVARQAARSRGRDRRLARRGAADPGGERRATSRACTRRGWQKARATATNHRGSYRIALRYRHNPDVQSWWRWCRQSSRCC